MPLSSSRFTLQNARRGCCENTTSERRSLEFREDLGWNPIGKKLTWKVALHRMVSKPRLKEGMVILYTKRSHTWCTLYVWPRYITLYWWFYVFFGWIATFLLGEPQNSRFFPMPTKKSTQIFGRAWRVFPPLALESRPLMPILELRDENELRDGLNT